MSQSVPQSNPEGKIGPPGAQLVREYVVMHASRFGAAALANTGDHGESDEPKQSFGPIYIRNVFRSFRQQRAFYTGYDVIDMRRPKAINPARHSSRGPGRRPSRVRRAQRVVARSTTTKSASTSGPSSDGDGDPPPASQADDLEVPR